jgi:DNA-binding HxlR family transcriptional regulator
MGIFGTIRYLYPVKKRKIPITLNCGLDLIGEVLYGKWKIRLLYFIHEGHKRPSELHRKIPDASQRVLNMQLKELEEHELISKLIYPEMPPKVEYNLTDFGKSLIPLIRGIGDWADDHQDQLRAVIAKRR